VHKPGALAAGFEQLAAAHRRGLQLHPKWSSAQFGIITPIYSPPRPTTFRGVCGDGQHPVSGGDPRTVFASRRSAVVQVHHQSGRLSSVHRNQLQRAQRYLFDPNMRMPYTMNWSADSVPVHQHLARRAAVSGSAGVVCSTTGTSRAALNVRATRRDSTRSARSIRTSSRIRSSPDPALLELRPQHLSRHALRAEKRYSTA